MASGQRPWWFSLKTEVPLHMQPAPFLGLLWELWPSLVDYDSPYLVLVINGFLEECLAVSGHFGGPVRGP